MAIALDCINFIVPITVLESRYPGGFASFLDDHESLVGTRIWHDEYLVRDGAMSPMDAFLIQENWKSKGLVAKRRKAGVQTWKDYCVIETLSNSAPLPCQWLVVSDDRSYAYLSGTKPGDVIGSGDRDW